MSVPCGLARCAVNLARSIYAPKRPVGTNTRNGTHTRRENAGPALSRLQPMEQYVSLASANLEVRSRLAVPRLNSYTQFIMPAHHSCTPRGATFCRQLVRCRSGCDFSFSNGCQTNPSIPRRSATSIHFHNKLRILHGASPRYRR